jgi:microcystin-dependent protein
MAFTLTPNMSLVIPGVGSEQGPNYAADINSSLTILDSHDHSSGSGVQINPTGLNINSSLTFQSNAATNLGYANFSLRTSAPSAAQSLYVQNGSESVPLPDLWYYDGTNNVQITKGGAVNSTTESIPGESYGAGTFTWRTVVSGSATNTPANFDIGSIVIRPSVNNTTFGVTLAPNSALSGSLTLYLPDAVPSQTNFVTLDSSGNLSTASGIQPNQIATGSIGPSLLTSGIGLNPAGAIVAYGGQFAPAGYLLCDGTSYATASYSALFNAIGYAYGGSSANFNVPDLRGRFARGLSGTSGNDPDASSRVASNTGGNTGNNIGSYQGSNFAAHGHFISPMEVVNYNIATGGVDGTYSTIGGGTTDTSSAGGNETRPVNVYVNFIIKT